jgi:hypothetical protein
MTLTQAEMEARYDAERSGTAYAKPAGDLITATLEYLATDEQAVAAWIDQHVSITHEYGEEYACTNYIAGSIRITRQHNGYVPTGGTPNMLEIGGQSIDMPWTLPMLQQVHTDLGRLLSDARVVAALESEPEATDDMIAILEEIDGGERKGIDARFDRCIDAVAELPDAQRAIAISMWEGFLAGVQAA